MTEEQKKIIPLKDKPQKDKRSAETALKDKAGVIVDELKLRKALIEKSRWDNMTDEPKKIIALNEKPEGTT